MLSAHVCTEDSLSRSKRSAEDMRKQHNKKHIQRDDRDEIKRHFARAGHSSFSEAIFAVSCFKHF